MIISVAWIFLSTLPARGATVYHRVHQPPKCAISIHAPREGSDKQHDAVHGLCNISIHAPREGSDGGETCAAGSPPANFYPRSPRGERLGRVPLGLAYPFEISIHAPREGSDQFLVLLTVDKQNFYPRSPRGERPISRPSAKRSNGFLSTLPARGATGETCAAGSPPANFYPRSPRGERLFNR